MSKPLQGQVAIITGASRGIGRVCALTLARAGCNVVVSAKSTQEQPNLPGTIFSVAKEVEAEGVQAMPFKCNVLEADEIQAMVDATIKRFGRVDIMMNNAGALWWKKMIDTPVKRYDLINGVNARATFLCSKAVLPHMLKQKHGHIVNMSPPINMEMLDGKIGYCMSKFGMTLVAHGIAQEYKGQGVACNALWPATMIESYATINFQMGTPSMWRKGEIIADALLGIVQEDPNTFSGYALIDEDFLRSRGTTDFAKYRCDPDSEPMRIGNFGGGFERGMVQEVASPYEGLEGKVKARL
eukprot:TRINITY_DN956_c0_g1_i1.p1 TRINITY_DN956_c0_g1~~TRINITY_DN956_c0_g1_i1.p1  ORF type:complete len:298 (+),score=132.90 TRINITY_DN956_c0_g1_i1:135-1028(+)